MVEIGIQTVIFYSIIFMSMSGLKQVIDNTITLQYMHTRHRSKLIDKIYAFDLKT